MGSTDDVLDALEGFIHKVRQHAQLNEQRDCLCGAMVRRTIAADLEGMVRQWRQWAAEVERVA